MLAELLPEWRVGLLRRLVACLQHLYQGSVFHVLNEAPTPVRRVCTHVTLTLYATYQKHPCSWEAVSSTVSLLILLTHITEPSAEELLRAWRAPREVVSVQEPRLI